MPRLPPQLLQRAKSISPDLATLLPACRDLTSASNELRWLKEHVDKLTAYDKQWRLSKLCRKRGRGVPLQYILGSQPFGSLHVLCKPGVLIPRPETEAYTLHLVDLIKSGSLAGSTPADGLTILDFCTGPGCISLLLFSALQSSAPSLSVCGVDVSPLALRLARKNLVHNAGIGSTGQSGRNQSLRFDKVDVFSDADIQTLARATNSRLDLMISNPPYVSKDTWTYGRGQMGYSVSKYEPKLALVPGDHLPLVPDGLGLEQEDVFYYRLLDIALVLKPRAVFFEVGDEEQAYRVARFSHYHDFSPAGTCIEIWRDWPDMSGSEEGSGIVLLTSLEGNKLDVSIKGQGNVRAVLIKPPQSIE